MVSSNYLSVELVLLRSPGARGPSTYTEHIYRYAYKHKTTIRTPELTKKLFGKENTFALYHLGFFSLSKVFSCVCLLSSECLLFGMRFYGGEGIGAVKEAKRQTRIELSGLVSVGIFDDFTRDYSIFSF